VTGFCRIGFGGGCHWCTEAVFMTLHGVSSVKQGFIKSEYPNDTFSEAVIVNYDTELIGLNELIEVHLRTHASSSKHRMRDKYRSAIYTFDDVQYRDCAQEICRLQQGSKQSLVTQILPHADFKVSGNKYRNYYYKDKNRPFCRTYIEPKIQLLHEHFSQLVIER